ncbi:MAG TPA: hypothetical protein VNS60_09440 [Solirubrobacterales bacterium]|nr:hypothetical protein [Solirubrobacterales bacterium]
MAPSPTPFATSLATPFPFDWLDRGLLLAPFARDFVAVALRPLDLRVAFAFALVVFTLEVLEALDFVAGFALFVFV